MIRHYIKITLLQFRKHLLISILNIAGLAIGMACFILIMLYVIHELQYDRYNENYDDIYRMAVDAKIGNTLIRCTWTPAPLPAAMYEEFPEVRAVTRIFDRAQRVKFGDHIYEEERAAAVDSAFTKIFTLNYIEGSPGPMLNEPGQVLLDKSTARKYFGYESAYGQVIKIRDTIPLTVVGVYEDFPSQSHFHFNMLISLLSFDGLYNNPKWFANEFKTYMLLEPGFPAKELEGKLPSFIDKYLYQGTYEESTDDENYWKFYLQQIREIHLGSDLDGEFETNGNLAYVRIFSIIALLLLLVACINYVNLTTARSATRTREVGVRKTYGASREKLRMQFFGESLIYSFLALILAIGLVELVMGPYRSITGREIEFHYLDNLLLILGLMALPIIVGLLAGIYPAYYINRFSAVDSLGFNKEQVVLVKNIAYMNNLEAYKDELKSRPEVIQFSVSSWVPGDKITNWAFGADGVEQDFSLNVNFADENYAETMGIETVSGRYFSTEFNADMDKIVLNETAVRLLEMEDPIGRITYLWGDRALPYKVIGVVKDYHWESKHMKVRPHALLLLSERFRDPYYLSIRIAGSDYKKFIETLQDDWERYVPTIPFQYEILDRHYDGIYRNEKKIRSLLIFFSVITIIISCLGLFGLTAFMAERRTREIGIRKSNGASTGHILRLMSLDSTKWVILANIVAWPITWMAMRRWLESFAYRIEIPLWIFGLAGIIAFLIAFATVSFHAIRASMQNPGISLRYE